MDHFIGHFKKISGLLCLCLLTLTMGRAQAAQTSAALAVRAQALCKAQHFAEAAQLLQASLKKFPSPQDQKTLKGALADTQFGWALALWHTQKNYEAAVKQAQAALALDKNARPAQAADEENKIGQILHLQRRNKEAIAYFEQARQSDGQRRDQTGEAAMLLALGIAYGELSRYDKALDCYGQALPLARALHDPLGESAILDGIATAYGGLGQIDKVIGYLQQAVAAGKAAQGQPPDRGIAACVGDIFGSESKDIIKNIQGRLIGNLGEAYLAQGHYDQAAASFEQALALSRKNGDQQEEAFLLAGLGMMYGSLGQLEKAAGYMEQALPVLRKQDYSGQEETLLMALANVHHALGHDDQARGEWEQALTLARRVKDRDTEGTILTSLGIAALGKDTTQAAAYLEQGRAVAKEIGDRAAEAMALKYLGVAILRDRPYQAEADGQQALAIEREIGNPGSEAETLVLLMLAAGEEGRARLAIFYGKQAINGYQAVRGSIRGFDQDTQKSFLTSHTDTYRSLADLLIGQGRLPEAQQVLGLLKEQELTDFLRGAAGAGGAAGHLDLTPAEQAEDAQYQAIADQVTALGRQKQALLDKDKKAVAAGPAFTAADQTQLDALTASLSLATRRLQDFLTHLANAFEAPLTENQSVQKRLAAIQDSDDLQGTLSELHTQGQDVVVLETVVAPDRCVVIVTTAQSQKFAQTLIKSDALNAKVAAFQTALRDPTVDPRPLSKQLYDILVAPIEKDLAQSGAKTLMWSLDGTLRYIPIAALYDGKQYLVERFDNEVFTLGRRSGFEPSAPAHWRGLGLGVSLAHTDFNPLPAVPDELRGVIHDGGTAQSGGAVPGTVLLDPAFTQAAMTHALQQGTYNLVHIASHFALKPGDSDHSFLLLGDGGHLSLSDVAADHTLFQGVDLLSLSACDTATGGAGADGKEVDSLGSIAQKDGAKSVVASLWPVADASTRELMQTFYQWHETHAGVSKAEALRQAQLSLLRGSAPAAADMSHRGTEAVPSRGESPSLPPFVADPNAPYAHPFYWAPFILIGNWR